MVIFIKLLHSNITHRNLAVVNINWMQKLNTVWKIHTLLEYFFYHLVKACNVWFRYYLSKNCKYTVFVFIFLSNYRTLQFLSSKDFFKSLPSVQPVVRISWSARNKTAFGGAVNMTKSFCYLWYYKLY